TTKCGADDDEPERDAAFDHWSRLRLRVRDRGSVRRDGFELGRCVSMGRRVWIELPRRSGCANGPRVHDSADSKPHRSRTGHSHARLSGAHRATAHEMIPDLTQSVLAAWRTNNDVTVFLISHIPQSIWPAPLPAIPRKSIAMIGAHLHNSRRSWLRTLGEPHGITVPAAV